MCDISLEDGFPRADAHLTHIAVGYATEGTEWYLTQALLDGPGPISRSPCGSRGRGGI